MRMVLGWCLGLLLAAVIAAAPVAYYRAVYTDYKRLRVVTPGVLYRSGQMTEQGFREAVRRHGIRTIVNVQNEYPDPAIWRGFLDRRSIPESQLCRELGVKYVHLSPDLLPRSRVPEARPEVISQWLAVVDDKANHPILIHCKAGLHRTGLLTAIYRMEYEGWSVERAMRELKANGFGDSACTCANDYVQQYVLTYRPGLRAGQERPAAAAGSATFSVPAGRAILQD